MRRDLFSLNELQLSAQEQAIAMQFEQRPSLVVGCSEPPVGVLRMVL
jgi:hypothetical protein